MKNMLKSIWQKFSIIFAINSAIKIVITYAGKLVVLPFCILIINFLSISQTPERIVNVLYKFVGENQFFIDMCLGISGYGLAFFIVFLGVVLSFKLIVKALEKILVLMQYELKCDAKLIDQMKLIAKWMALYGFCNILLQVFNCPDSVYKELAALFQAITLFILMKNNPFNYKVVRIKSRKITK